MSNLEKLLRSYQEGSLNPEELAELNRLTHRDQVLHAASQQVRAIRNRRYSAVAGVSAVLLVAGIVVFARPSVDNSLAEKPVVAQADVPTIDVSASENLLAPVQTEVRQVEVKPASSARHHDIDVLQPKPSLVSNEPVEQPVSIETVMEQREPSTIIDEPVVACNTQCSPDSVINDIWKFLRT
jgi:hypothetical protein